MYNKIKKQNGEKFAKAIRNYHNGILEIPNLDVMVRYAGREAEPLIPYLMSLLAANDDVPVAGNPFDLLKQAGYDAFTADTLEKQNGISRYFAEGELLCTFNDASRYKDYFIVHAIKEGADKIRREDFNGKEQRQDTYGTSVISIQMMKRGGFISIKNRYNHAVDNCDNTFSSNPDNIIQGLSYALKSHFHVEFSSSKVALPACYVLIDNQIFQYHTEFNNIYYGDGSWFEDGDIKMVDKSVGDAMFDGFIFDNKTKTLKKIDINSSDSFADDFNCCHGGNKGLYVKDGNLMLGDDVLIGAEKSRIKTVYLPELTMMGNDCLCSAGALTDFNAPLLTDMGGDNCLREAHALVNFNAPLLTVMGSGCLSEANALVNFSAPALVEMGSGCLYEVPFLVRFNAPVLTTMGDNCLRGSYLMTDFSAPMLTTMGRGSLFSSRLLIDFNAPLLTTMGVGCFQEAHALVNFNAPVLTEMGHACLFGARSLKVFKAPAVIAPDYISKYLLRNNSHGHGDISTTLNSLGLNP